MTDRGDGTASAANPRAADTGKRAAGRAAVSEVRSGTTIGLGTGSTVMHFLEALAEALSENRLTEVQGVATSLATEERARALGIPLVGLAEAEGLDVVVDGADEVDPSLDLIKGLGGALLREKMVVQAAGRFVVIVDRSKLVDRLGTHAPVPVEVVPFAWRSHLAFFEGLSADPRPRTVAGGGSLFLTDNGNPVVDLYFADGVSEPARLDRRLRERAGVVETGLFLGVAQRVLVGDSDGVESLEREEGTT